MSRAADVFTLQSKPFKLKSSKTEWTKIDMYTTPDWDMSCVDLQITGKRKNLLLENQMVRLAPTGAPL